MMQHKARGMCRAGERFIFSGTFDKLWWVGDVVSGCKHLVGGRICRHKMCRRVPGLDCKDRDGKSISAAQAHSREAWTRTLPHSSRRLLGS